MSKNMANNGIEPTTSNKALMEITTSDIDEKPEDNHEDSSDTIKKVMEKSKLENNRLTDDEFNQ
jgi:hypothetical protein